MFNFLTSVQFTPHGFCLSWDPALLGFLIIGNLLTAISYIIIPLEVLYLIRRGTIVGLVHNSATYLVAAFILLCGVSHQLDIITLWLPYYWLQAVWMLVTGIVSVITALSLPYLIEYKKGN